MKPTRHNHVSVKCLLWILLSIPFLTACQHNGPPPQQFSDAVRPFITIDYERSLNNGTTMHLSDIAADIRYIPLETREDVLVARVPDYFFSDSFIFVRNGSHILTYDYSGKFIRQIGTPGKGPNEIDLISNMSVIPNENRIVVQTNWSNKLIDFDFSGNVISSVNQPFEGANFYALPDSRYLAYYFCAIGIEDYQYMLTNNQWDTISTVLNHFKWENNTGVTGMVGYHSFKPFYTYKNGTYIKSMYNDTVFTVGDHAIEPSYYIDLGKYRLPDELRPEPPQSAQRFWNENGAYYFACALEAGKWIFVPTYCYSDDGDQKNLLFDKSTSTISYLTGRYGLPSNFINDVDGGPDFWPAGNVNDNEVYMIVSPLTLMDQFASDESPDDFEYDQVKRKEFEQLVNQLDENDNPVLMVVTLKD